MAVYLRRPRVIRSVTLPLQLRYAGRLQITYVHPQPTSSRPGREPPAAITNFCRVMGDPGLAGPQTRIWKGRFESPALQAASVSRTRVALVGVDVADQSTAARALSGRFDELSQFDDPNHRIARSLEASGLYPQTRYYNGRG